MQINPKAIFDSLSVAHKLDDSIDGFVKDEIHLFAYFSAVLFGFKGNPMSEWSYQFIVGVNGYPHSKDLSDAIERNILNGHFQMMGGYLTITGRGTDEFRKFSEFFPTYKDREQYIEAACSTSVIIPYKETKAALLDDPNITRNKDLGNEEWITFNYEQLSKVTSELGAPADNLLIPAITWVEVLNQIKE